MTREIVSIKPIKKIIIIIMIGLILFIMCDLIRKQIDSRNLRGVFLFYEDIEEAEKVNVYDKDDSVVVEYKGNQLESLISKYINNEASYKIPWPKYKREVNRYLKDLEFTVEVVFPQDRNEDKENREFVKNMPAEILSIYRIDIKDIKEKSLYNQYTISIDGQDYVVFLRDILLQICNTD